MSGPPSWAIVLLIMEPQFISPKYQKTDFPPPISLDQKIEIFRDRVEGWQLDVARECQKIPHSGFGVLYICLSYFEMVARYQAGSTSHSDVGKFFKAGFSRFIAGKPISRDPNFQTVRKVLYEGARCGLYHISTTSKGVYISGDRSESLTYDANLSRLVIHPGKLIDEICTDFKGYIAQLQNPAEASLRNNFEQKFDHDILPQIT